VVAGRTYAPPNPSIRSPRRPRNPRRTRQARANRGILYVDEVNLLDDGLVDVVLDSAASGVNTVEREGISIAHPAKFIMIGSGNPQVRGVDVVGCLLGRVHWIGSDRLLFETGLLCCFKVWRKNLETQPSQQAPHPHKPPHHNQTQPALRRRASSARSCWTASACLSRSGR